MEEAFDQERMVYLEFIKSLESRRYFFFFWVSRFLPLSFWSAIVTPFLAEYLVPLFLVAIFVVVSIS